MNEQNISVKVVKPFLDGSEFADVGAVISTTEDRARQLEQNGLVSRDTSEPEKAAPVHANKKARDPKNK